MPTLNLSPENPPETPFKPLQRVIPWTDGGCIVLLQYDNMPPFCRLCQADDHCRADCPKYKSYLRCHNCNDTGHIMRNCPRNNVRVEVVPVPFKKQQVVDSLKSTTRKTPKTKPSTSSGVPPISEDRTGSPPPTPFLNPVDSLPPPTTVNTDIMEIDPSPGSDIDILPQETTEMVPYPTIDGMANDFPPLPISTRRNSVSGQSPTAPKYQKTTDATDISTVLRKMVPVFSKTKHLVVPTVSTNFNRDVQYINRKPDFTGFRRHKGKSYPTKIERMVGV